MTYDVESPGSGLGHAQKSDPNPPPLYNCISKGSTDINKQ